MNHFHLAWKNVRRNRRRSLVTILIAAVGCAAILVASGFALYTYDMLSDSAAREYGHITIAEKAFFEQEEETPMQFGMVDYKALTTQLRSSPQVKKVLPRVSFSGLVSNGDKSVIFLGTGADTALETEMRGRFLRVLEGNVRAPQKNALPYVLLGVDLAHSLGAKPGSSLTLLSTTASTGGINAIDVEVSGIVTTGWSELDKRLVYTDIDAAQKLLMTDRVSTLSVYLDNLDRVSETIQDLSSENAGKTLRPWWEQAFYYNSVKGLYNRIFGLLGFIIATLVLFSVINTLAMAVVERTREIGTLRALGAHPEEIVAQFVREGFLIGVVGVLAGNLLAWLVIAILPGLGLQMPPPPGRSEGYPLLVSASVNLFVITNLIIIVLCTVAAWAVSRNAARKAIVEALGHV
jgi:putative ABC transport system permease protein